MYDIYKFDYQYHNLKHEVIKFYLHFKDFDYSTANLKILHQQVKKRTRSNEDVILFATELQKCNEDDRFIFELTSNHFLNVSKALIKYNNFEQTKKIDRKSVV